MIIDNGKIYITIIVKICLGYTPGCSLRNVRHKGCDFFKFTLSGAGKKLIWFCKWI